MHILIISQYFWPEEFRINEVARSLSRRGIGVSVLTGQPNYPQGIVYKGYSAYQCGSENWDGVRIFRVPTFPRGRANPVLLAINYISFIFSAILFGPWLLRRQNPSLIYVYAPSPIIQAIPALLIGKMRGIPTVINVQDLWPESVEATGHISNSLLLSLIRCVVRYIYRAAALIVVPSLSFKTAIEEMAPDSKIVYLPNSVPSYFQSAVTNAQKYTFMEDCRFSVVFAGNLGVAQSLDVILDAAESLLGNDSIKFFLIGDGNRFDWLKGEKDRRGLSNLSILGRYPEKSMPDILSKASVLVAALLDRPIFSLTVPNKIQAYLSVGRPIIASMNGEGARIIEEAGAGVSVPAEDAAALSRAILQIYALPDSQRREMGKSGKRYFRQHYDNAKLLDLLLQEFHTLSGRKL